MARHAALDRRIGVRIPGGQPVIHSASADCGRGALIAKYGSSWFLVVVTIKIDTRIFELVEKSGLAKSFSRLLATGAQNATAWQSRCSHATLTTTDKRG